MKVALGHKSFGRATYPKFVDDELGWPNEPTAIFDTGSMTTDSLERAARELVAECLNVGGECAVCVMSWDTERMEMEHEAGCPAVALDAALLKRAPQQQEDGRKLLERLDAVWDEYDECHYCGRIEPWFNAGVKHDADCVVVAVRAFLAAPSSGDVGQASVQEVGHKSGSPSKEGSAQSGTPATSPVPSPRVRLVVSPEREI